jgi:hypothetical protein
MITTHALNDPDFAERHRIDVVTETVGYLLRDRTGAWRARGPQDEVLSGYRTDRLFFDGPEDALHWLLRARGLYPRLYPQLFPMPTEAEEAADHA